MWMYSPESSSVWQLILAPTQFKGKELRSLRFFEERTASQMNGFFPCDFWNELVPQIAHAEPSIRHALVALSGFHEQFMLQDSADESYANFGLQQYNLAIKELLNSWTRGNPLVALLCCVLFVAIEVCQKAQPAF